MTHGKAAYEAYRAQPCWESGMCWQWIPSWVHLRVEEQQAWGAAAQAVADELRREHISAIDHLTGVIDLVAEMRHAQIDYFRLRSPSVLQHAKTLERRVDAACREVLEADRQGKLFG